MNTTLSYRTEFEAAYIQTGELHAHRYKLEVTVADPNRLKADGRILDYKILSKYVRDICPDGKYLIGLDTSTFESNAAAAIKACGVELVTYPFILSIENLCRCIAEELQDVLDRHEYGVQVVEAKLRETNDSYASWSIG